MNHVTRSFFLLSLVVSCTAFAAKKPTNFVFFLVDDMGWADIGANGSKFHETPHIDKLAATGMKFTNGYFIVDFGEGIRESVFGEDLEAASS